MTFFGALHHLQRAGAKAVDRLFGFSLTAEELQWLENSTQKHDTDAPRREHSRDEAGLPQTPPNFI